MCELHRGLARPQTATDTLRGNASTLPKTPRHDDPWHMLASYLGKKSVGSLALNSCKATLPIPIVALDAASKAT